MKFDPTFPGQYPDVLYPDYRSTTLRGPKLAPIRLEAIAPATTGVEFRKSILVPKDADLTAHGREEPLGQRITVTGVVRDEDRKPVRNSLVEIWQCSSTGRYPHKRDQHNAPLDPNFPGFGKTFTDDEGRYRFVTIKPGSYPWGNHYNAWRPAHIHFSLFGNAYAQRVITQMYFPDDPLFEFDPIFNSIPDERARKSLISRFSMDDTIDGEALGYVFDIVLRGHDATPTGL
jgi:protocatechuate 3,4-dioxygenase beta subunit